MQVVCPRICKPPSREFPTTDGFVRKDAGERIKFALNKLNITVAE